MNPLYAIMESRHRWSILAGIIFIVALVGAMMIMTYGWSLTFARIWLYLGLLFTAYCLVRAFMDWRAALQAADPSVKD